MRTWPELVRHDALELGVVHDLEQAGGRRDDGVLGVAAGRERVRRRVGDRRTPCGIGVPVVIERFSTVRQSRGWSALLCISTAPDIESAWRSAVKYWNSAYAVAIDERDDDDRDVL